MELERRRFDHRHQLPTNPRSPTYLVICFVCKEVAKPNHEHALHYGGIVCLSCRAFFRRACQKTKHPDFICKNRNSCEITPQNRRRCQKCRFERCLLAGMSPDAVLTEEERTVRFRKMLEKKQRLANDQTTGSETTEIDDRNLRQEIENELRLESNSSNEEFEHQPGPSADDDLQKLLEDLEPSNYSRKITPLENIYKELEDPSFTPKELSGLLDESPSLVATDVDMELEDDDEDEVGNDFEFLVNSIQQMYQNSCGQTDEFFRVLLRSRDSGSNEIFSAYIGQLTSRFVNFAALQRKFLALPKQDQDALLARNKPIFVQLCFGCDLISQSTQAIKSYDFLLESGPTTLNISPPWNRLFKRDADLIYYNKLLSSLKRIPDISSQRIRSFLSYCCLFFVDETIRLRESDMVVAIRKENETTFAKLVRGLTPLNKVQSTLSKMSAFCASSIAWKKPGPCDPTGSQLALPYTLEEEAWLTNQLKSIEEAHNSVMWGEDISKEYLMYSLGVPVSKWFMKGVFKVELDRMSQAYKMHPEFQKLQPQTQLEILHRNGPAGLAMTVAKYESCNCGLRQLEACFGDGDKEKFREEYSSIFQLTSRLKKMTMRDVSSQSSVDLSENQIAEFDRLTAEFAGVASDPVYYRLLTLLALTRPVDSKNDLAPLKCYYEMLLRRRTEWLLKNEDARKREKILRGVDDANVFVSKWLSNLSDLDKLSEILLFIMNGE